MNATRDISNLTLSQIQERGLEHLLNKKKNFKAGPGRPRKILDKRTQFSLTFWFQLLMKDYNKLRPIQKTRIALDCWKTLINKANDVPSDPEESKLNASEAMALLKDAENKSNPSTTPIESDKELVYMRPNPTGEKIIEREKVLA